MFSGPPLPLRPELPLGQLLAQARLPGRLGAWVRGCRRSFRLYGAHRALVLVSADLGFLLGRCSRVAVREGAESIIIHASVLIQWRALQVVAATPYLPGLERLSVMFPGLQPIPAGFQVPLLSRSPEDVLAECLAQGIPVAGSRIIYCAPAAPEAYVPFR